MTFLKFQLEYFCNQAELDHCAMMKQILIIFFLPFQNDADLIVSYSTYQAETTAISTGPGGRGAVGQAVGSAGVATGGVISASSSGQRRIIATSSWSTRHPGPGGAAIGKLPHHYESCSFVGIEVFLPFELNKIEVHGQTLCALCGYACTRYESNCFNTFTWKSTNVSRWRKKVLQQTQKFLQCF